MSTFLFALVVGQFRVKEVKYKKRVDLRVATVIENKELLDKVMGYAVDCLESMEEYTQVEYPMKKLDHIDVLRMPPLAMQNFGLITYSNSFGITSDLEIKEELEQRRLVCHETAHQWFSNIITTNDWGQIFLHEGFATYFEDIVFKTSTNDEKITLETKRVQNFQDGIEEKLFNDHPIISNKFISDETVYLSAGAVIQMIENVIGRGKFRNAIQILIKEHFLSNFDYNDVIRSFEKLAGPNLCGKEVTTRNFISQYLHSKDAPVVKVHKSPSKYILSQISREKYTVPLFISNGWNETLIWLLPDNSLCHPEANSMDILITNQTLAFNYKYQAFARFEYDHNVYSRYLKSIHKMDDVTVFNILMDFRENLGTEMFIDLAAAAVQTKRTSLVWKVIVDYVYEKFEDVSIPKPLKKALRRLERNFLWKESSNLVIRQLQNEVSSFLVDAEVGDAVEKAYKLFQTNFSSCKSNLWSCNRIPADLRPAVYCAAIKSDSKNLKFFKNYQKSLSQISLIPQAFESELSAIDYAFNCQ